MWVYLSLLCFSQLDRPPPLQTHTQLAEWRSSLVTFLVGCLLEFYVQATFRVILVWVPTCDIVHSWHLSSVASLEDHDVSTNT